MNRIVKTKHNTHINPYLYLNKKRQQGQSKKI